MILATTQVEDFDRFLSVFSTKGADKRRQHGSKGATVFRDPNEADRVWVLFDWDADGWQSFVSDPEVPPIMQEAGHKGRPPGCRTGRPLRRLALSRQKRRVVSKPRECGVSSIGVMTRVATGGNPGEQVSGIGCGSSGVPQSGPGTASVRYPNNVICREHDERGCGDHRPWSRILSSSVRPS